MVVLTTHNTVDYTYDANGNLTKDSNKDIDTIIYNYLNLPQDIIGGTDTISYFYTADGTEIAQVNNQGLERFYLSNLVYNDDTLNHILTSEGMVNVSNSGGTANYTYQYFLKDHLGNTRVAFNESGATAEVKQVSNYYPFGMKFVYSEPRINIDNRYLYNGKELQDDLINGTKLDWYDYGARMYDPTLARFTTIDPMAAIFNNQSGYLYAYNNPIRYIDFKGMNAEEKGKEEAQQQDPKKKEEPKTVKPKAKEPTVVELEFTFPETPEKSNKKKDEKSDNYVEKNNENEVSDGVDMDWWTSPTGNSERNVIDRENEKFEEIFSDGKSSGYSTKKKRTSRSTKKQRAYDDKRINDASYGDTIKDVLYGGTTSPKVYYDVIVDTTADGTNTPKRIEPPQ